MNVISRDGAAVGAARGLMVEQGVAEHAPWRSTVVPGEDDGWVVRTWTSTPTGDSRPSGTPDFVHVVSGSLAVQQVHPST